MISRAPPAIRDKQRTVNSAKAIAPQSERVGHHSEPVLSDVESELPRVRPFGRGVRDDHFGERCAVHDWTGAAFVLVKVLDGVEDDPLAVLLRKEKERVGRRSPRATTPRACVRCNRCAYPSFAT
jgi:hypothetical protein